MHEQSLAIPLSELLTLAGKWTSWDDGQVTHHCVLK